VVDDKLRCGAAGGPPCKGPDGSLLISEDGCQWDYGFWYAPPLARAVFKMLSVGRNNNEVNMEKTVIACLVVAGIRFRPDVERGRKPKQGPRAANLVRRIMGAPR